MVIATWKIPALRKNIDAQTVYEEITSIGDEIKPEQIVEKARDENTELHKCFEWDDTKAAEKWRLHQARNVVCELVFKQENLQDKEEYVPIRVLCKTDSNSYYKVPEIVFKNADEHEKLLQSAMAELQAFKRKYHALTELDYILTLID